MNGFDAKARREEQKWLIIIVSVHHSWIFVDAVSLGTPDLNVFVKHNEAGNDSLVSDEPSQHCIIGHKIGYLLATCAFLRGTNKYIGYN